ncbi:MAG: hypothetical protein IT355_12135 [Gemmatimonadaceae bacterium]|nr:hypothetical protein [Gemmatimonadaceae bacterium]
MALEQLQELRTRRGALADLPAATQWCIRQAVGWLGRQQLTTPVPADLVPSAVARIGDALAADTVPTIQRADLDLLITFASSLVPPAPKPAAKTGGRR